MLARFDRTTGVTVRREKALGFSGCNSRPGTGSLHPVAIEAAAEATKRSELSMGRVAGRSQVANYASRALLPSTFGSKRKEILIHRSVHLSLETTKLLAATCIRHFGT